MQILNWKYYSEYESNRVILAKQARRVTEKLEELEGNGPESIQQTVTPPSSGFAGGSPVPLPIVGIGYRLREEV
jgi:hypothetical protein